MAVIVEFAVPHATYEQMYSVEELTRARGEVAGRPPFTGCMFIAATADDSGFRFVSAWRTEADFEAVLDTMLGPDLATLSLAVADIRIAPAVSMAIPGAHNQ